MRARVSDDLRRKIEDDIVEGRLVPGDKLDEVSLAQRFSVSRTPAREALLRLAADGLVRFRPRQGAVIASMTPKLAIGMVEALTALEAEAAGLAARRMSIAERSALHDLHFASLSAVKAGDIAAYIGANSSFHAAIYAGARNQYLADQVKQTRLKARFFRHQSLSRPHRLRASWQEHERVLAAIDAGEEMEAREAMRAHIVAGGAVFAEMVVSDRPKP
jgi:DNA-binding GntR family transcriptional regulator